MIADRIAFHLVSEPLLIVDVHGMHEGLRFFTRWWSRKIHEDANSNSVNSGGELILILIVNINLLALVYEENYLSYPLMVV